MRLRELLLVAVGAALGTNGSPWAAQADGPSRSGAELQSEAPSRGSSPRAERDRDRPGRSCASHEVEAGRLVVPDAQRVRAALPCRFRAPGGADADTPLRVSLHAATADGEPAARVHGPRACGSGYYVEQSPYGPVVALCPATCASMQGKPHARVRIGRSCR